MTGAVVGYDWPNLQKVGAYAHAHGYSRAAAAGIASTVAGESDGYANAQGDGGYGLIGWTPVSKLPYYARSGSEAHQFNAQLPLILRYYSETPAIRWYKHFKGSPVQAAYYASKYFERPAITGSDVRANVAWIVYRKLGG